MLLLRRVLGRGQKDVAKQQLLEVWLKAGLVLG